MQHGHAARTNSRDMPHEHEAWTCSMHMQHGYAAWTCSMDMKHRNSERTCRLNKQHEKAVGKSSTDMHAPYSRPLLFSLPSGYGLWNRVSSVVRQREKKSTNSRFLSLALGASAFLALVFPRAPALISLLLARNHESAEKARAPTSDRNIWRIAKC